MRQVLGLLFAVLTVVTRLVTVPLLAALLATGCVETDRRPGEHEAQQATIIATPTYQTALDLDTEAMHHEMINAIIPDQRVVLIVNAQSECTSYRSALVANYGRTQQEVENYVECVVIRHSDVWVRDMGGIFVHSTVNDPGGPYDGMPVQAVIDPGFDGWGYGPYSDPVTQGLYAQDDKVAAKLARHLGYPIIESDLITEGGVYVTNGAGTVIYTIGAVTQRNPDWTIAEIEAEIARLFNADQVIGLPEWHPLDGHSVVDGPFQLNGVCYQQPLTVRHADEFVAFLDEDTLAVSQMLQADVRNSKEQEIKDMLDRTWTFLEQNTDFELVAFPEAGFIPRSLTADDPMWQYLGLLTPLPGASTPCEWTPDGGNISLAASYMNFGVSNGAVFAARLYKPGRDLKLQRLDAEMEALLTARYPGRRIEMIDAEAGHAGGGGLHCQTQEIWAEPTGFWSWVDQLASLFSYGGTTASDEESFSTSSSSSADGLSEASTTSSSAVDTGQDTGWQYLYDYWSQELMADDTGLGAAN